MAQTDSYTYLKNTSTSTTFNNLSLGNTTVTPYLGNKTVKEVYLGSNKIYGVTNIAGGYKLNIILPNVFNNYQTSYYVLVNEYDSTAYYISDNNSVNFNVARTPYIDSNNGDIITYIGNYYFGSVFDNGTDAFCISNVAESQYNSNYYQYAFRVEAEALNTSHTCRFALSYTVHTASSNGWDFNLKTTNKLCKVNKYLNPTDGYYYSTVTDELYESLAAQTWRSMNTYIINVRPDNWTSSTLFGGLNPGFYYTPTINCIVNCNGTNYNHSFKIKCYSQGRNNTTPSNPTTSLLNIYVVDRSNNYPSGFTKNIYFRFIDISTHQILNNELTIYTATNGVVQDYFGVTFNVTCSIDDYNNLTTQLSRYQLKYSFQNPIYAETIWYNAGTPIYFENGLLYDLDFR